MANETRYYKTPFAESGNKTEVPNVSTGGAVGYDTGFGPDYELPQGTVNRKRIERDMYNGVLNGVTGNIKQWQENLYPTWIEDNGDGVAFSYPEGMIVSHNDVDYVSLEDSNQEEPGSGNKWLSKASDINNLSKTHVFLNVNAFKTSQIDFPDDKKITTLGRLVAGDGFGGDYVKITGTSSANEHNIIASTDKNQSIDLIITDKVRIGQWIDSPPGAETAFPIIDTLGKMCVIDTPVITGALSTITSKVKFINNGSLDNTATLTFTDNVTSPRTNIFPGTGDIVLQGSNRVVYPESFGIFNEARGNDGSVDLTNNIKRCGRCLGDSQTAVTFGDGLYFVRDWSLDVSNTGFHGKGKDRTFIKNSPVNNTSTRFGVLLIAIAPNSVYNNNLGNRDWPGTDEVISDCSFKDFTVIWDDAATVATDPQMNGLAVLGCQGCIVENVHASLPTGQRAFAVQTNDPNQKTEDVIFRKCSSDGAISGVYISEGFVTNTGKSFKNIQVVDNHFAVRLLATSDPLGPSSPIIIHGFEAPANIDAGKVLIKGNHCEGGAKGIHTQSPDVGKKFNSQITVEDNSFENFREHGILSYMENMNIVRNEFDATSVQTDVVQAGGIVLYTNSEGGALKNTIRGNTFKNLSGTGALYAIFINANDGCNHLIDDNYFTYENGIAPDYDVFFLDGTGVLGDIKLSNNKFFDTGVANVRGTTVNQEMLYHDLGGNQGMNLFNGEIHGVRFAAPVDSRYYKRGTQLSFGIPVFTAGTQVGYMCTADHKPTAAGTWKNTIG